MTGTRSISTRSLAVALAACAVLASSVHAWAQAPAPPAAAPAEPPVWAGSVGVGLALTKGNSDTSNFNVNLKATYDPANPNKIIADGLYLRGSSEDVVLINRATVNVRDEFSLSSRVLLFGQVRYLRDTFKEIEYLVAPGAGVGYKLLRNDRTNLEVDAGVGLVSERDTGLGTTTTGAVIVGQTLSHKLSGSSTITENFSGLWKTSDFDDALYSFGAGITAAITRRSQLKVELLETYKNLPPVPTIDKQDVALVTSLVYSF